jgi:hypothetical protein
MSARALLRPAIGLSIVLAGSGVSNSQEPRASGARQDARSHSGFTPENPAQAAARLVEQLKRHPVQPKEAPDRVAIYLLDVNNGDVTLIADQPAPGLTHCGSPVWSHDGCRILYDATPGTQWSLTRLESIDLVDGRPTVTDLGAGNCPTFSPADDRIAFLSNADGVQNGVWLMNADGSERRFLGDYGRPMWSSAGRQLMIMSFADPRQVTLMDADPAKSGVLQLSGHKLFSHPSWAGDGTIVAVIGVTEAVALVDVSDQPPTVKEVLWSREHGPDVKPYYPVYLAAARRCIFAGAGANGMALYSVTRGQAGPAKPLLPDRYEPPISTLAESPDGRYLLFCIHGPDPMRAGLAPGAREPGKDGQEATNATSRKP